MNSDPNERPAKPEQTDENFGSGQEDRGTHPEDADVGRFDEGQDELPEDPERKHHGRFSEGQEAAGNPQHDEEGDFASGQGDLPPGEH